MRKKDYKLFILAVAILNISFIPDSKEDRKDYSFKKANIVFLGEVVLLEEDSDAGYKFIILEICKGVYDREMISGKIYADSTMYPNVAGLWLVYAQLLADNTIYILKNSVSRSNFDPDLTWWYRNNIPPPLLDSSQVGILNWKIEELERKNEATVEWYNDLEKLRMGKPLSKSPSINIPYVLSVFLIASNVILVLILIISLRKRKRPDSN